MTSQLPLPPRQDLSMSQLGNAFKLLSVSPHPDRCIRLLGQCSAPCCIGIGRLKSSEIRAGLGTISSRRCGTRIPGRVALRCPPPTGATGPPPTAHTTNPADIKVEGRDQVVPNCGHL